MKLKIVGLIFFLASLFLSVWSTQAGVMDGVGCKPAVIRSFGGRIELSLSERITVYVAGSCETYRQIGLYAEGSTAEPSIFYQNNPTAYRIMKMFKEESVVNHPEIGYLPYEWKVQIWCGESTTERPHGYYCIPAVKRTDGVIELLPVLPLMDGPSHDHVMMLASIRVSKS